MSTKLIIAIVLCFFYSCNTRVSNQKFETDKIDTVEFKKFVASYASGKIIFERFCTTCHFTPGKGTQDPPLLDNLFERLPKPAKSYFIKYVSDSKSLKLSGDEYAKHLNEMWDFKYEHNFKGSLSVQGFKDLIIYIETAGQKK